MSLADRERWDGKYAAKSVPERLAPDEWLMRQVSTLRPGRALELACGLGHNAIWLAQQGWQVDAVDVSLVGLNLAREFAERHRIDVNWIAADLDTYVPESEAYDLAVVFRFLDRIRVPPLMEAALRPGGLLVYETFTQSHTHRLDSHMRNPAFALAPGELPQLFSALTVQTTEETELPDRNVARLVAQR